MVLKRIKTFSKFEKGVLESKNEGNFFVDDILDKNIDIEDITILITFGYEISNHILERF